MPLPPQSASPPSPHIPLTRLPNLTLNLSSPKGRAVHTSSAISAGTVIDTCPILLLSPAENALHIEHTVLHHYTYTWPLPAATSNSSPDALDKKATQVQTQALVLGLGSMFNHSSSARGQNVGWTRDLVAGVVVYRALRDIEAGEELCISYGARLTFSDADANADGLADANGGETEEAEESSGEEMLSRIELG